MYFLDRKTLYSTIVNVLHDMEGCSTIQYHYGRSVLSKALEQCGAKYIQYASIIDEQAMLSRDPLVLPYCCDVCSDPEASDMQGPRFTCLSCLDSDFCANCFALWKTGDDTIRMCKGHTFREVPRPCWYTLKPGTVTEDGKTLAEVIDFLHSHFTGLLSDLAQEAECTAST